ncbi:uncharacterized protein LOC144098817 isoform X1 [Amblyomma americanum]
MSWAEGAWKDGLTPLVLRKVEAFEQQVTRLQKDCQQKQTQIDYLQQQLDKEKRKNDEEKGASGGLMRDMRALESELAELTTKHSKLQQELAMKETQLRQLDGQPKASSSQPLLEPAYPSTPVGRSRFQRCAYGDTPVTPGYRDLQSKVAELEAKLRERQDGNQPASVPSTPVRAHSLDRSSHEMDRLRNDNVQLRGQVQELEQRAQKLNKQMECQTHNSEAARKALEQRCRDKEAELKEELRLQMQESDQLRKELNTTQARLQQELTAATKFLDATKAQLERSEAKLSSQESLVADLRKQVSNLEQQERQSSIQLADLNRALKSQEQGTKALEAKNANMEVKIRELEAASDTANREARRLEAELRKSAQDLEQRSQDLAQLQNRLANTKTQLLAVENQKQCLEKERSQSCAELKRESTRCQDLESQLQKAKEKMDELQQSIGQSSGATERLRTELDRSQKYVTDCNVKIQKLESKLEGCDRREREAIEKVLALECNVQDLQKAAAESHVLAKALREKEAEVSMLAKSKQALEETVKQLSSEVAALSLELSDEKARVALLEKEIADGKDLVSRAEKLQKDYEEAAQHVEKMKASLRNSEQEKQELQDELAGRVVECEKVPGLESALQECKAQLAKSETRVRELEGLLSERENEKMNLLKSLSEKEMTLKDFESKADTLQRDAEKVDIELGSVRDRLLKSDEALKGHELALKEREVLLEGVKKELDDAVQKVQNLQQAEAEQRQLAQEKEAEITALKQDISAEKELSKLLEQQSLSILEMESSKSALELELVRMEERYAALQQEHEKCLELVESKDTDVLTLRSLVQEKEAVMENLQGRLAIAEKNGSRLAGEMCREKQALEEKLSLAMSDISSLKKELNEQAELQRKVAGEVEAMSAELAEQRTSNEVLLEEKKLLVFAQVALEEEVAASKRRIEELQETRAALDSQLSARGAQVQALQEEIDRLLQHEVARVQGELCLKNAEIDGLKRAIEDHCEKQKESEILRQQVAAAMNQCSLFEQECEALRQKCEVAASREKELLSKLQVLSCQRDEESAEREALEHDLVERNAERDEGLLQLASAQSYLEQALVVGTEKEARIHELERLATETTAALDAQKEETASLSEALRAAGDMLKEGQERQLQLERQLESREATIAALTQEATQMTNAEAEAIAALKERLAAFEGFREDVEELRQQLVERNGERDDLYMALMRVQSETAVREQELGLALVEALEREAEGPVRLLQYLRDNGAALQQAVPSHAQGLANPLPHVVSALLEMHRTAIGLLDDLSSALQTRHACLQEECQRLAALDPRPEDKVVSIDSALQKVLAQRQEVTERIARVKGMAEAAVQWAESSSLAERVGSSQQEEDLSLLDSSSFTAPKDSIMLDDTASHLPEDLSRCQTEATVGYTDTTNTSTCELTLSSSDSNGHEDELVDKMAHVCSLLTALRQSLHGLLNQTSVPPHALLGTPLLSEYARRVEEEYATLQQSVGILKGRLPSHGEQESSCTVNVTSELRVQCDGTVEAAATVFFSPALPQVEEEEEEEEEESFASFDDEPSSSNPQSSEREPGSQPESKTKQTEALRAAFAAFEAKLNAFLGALAELSCKEEMRDEVSTEGDKQGEVCGKLLDHIEMWASLFREFFKQVKEASTQIMQILCEGGHTAGLEVEQEKPFMQSELAFLRQLVQSALHQRDEHEKDFKVLQQSLLDEQSTAQAVRQALEEQEQKTCQLQLQLSILQQQQQLANGATEAEVPSLSQKVEAYELTIKQLNSALEEVEDALQSTVAEKQKYEESAAAFQDQCARAEEELQRVQLEFMEVKEAAEKALAKKSQLLTEFMDAKAVSESESRQLLAQVDGLMRDLCEAMQSKKEIEDKLEDKNRQLAALKLNVEHLLASNSAFEKCSEALKEELKSSRAMQEAQVAEIRKMCLTMDVSFSELSAVGDVEVDLATLKDAFSRRQQEFSGQLQQLAEERNAALSEVTELRERFSQIQAERERLEEDKRTLMLQAEEQEEELLNTDYLLEEKRLLQADVERLVTKLDEMEELRVRVVSLEEEKSAREVHIESLLLVQSSARQVQQQLTEREQQLAALEEEIVPLRTKESELEGARQVVSTLEGNLADLKLQYDASQKELEALSGVQAKLQCVEASEAELKGHVDTLKDRNEQQTQELKQLTRELECLQASAEESSGALQALRDQLAAKEEKAAALTTDVTRLATELAKHKQLLQLSQEEADRQAAVQLSLEHTIQQMGEEKDTTTKKLQSSKEENESLKSLLNQKSELSERLRGEFDGACQHLEQLKAELTHLVTEQKEHEQQLAQAHGEIGMLSTSKSILEGEVSGLLLKLDVANEGRCQAESEAESARLLLEEKTSEVEQLQSDLSRASGQLEESRAEVVRLATEQQKQQQELEAAQDEIKKLLASKSALESKVSELLQMLDTAQEKCARAGHEAQSMKLLLDEKSSNLECMQSDFDSVRHEFEQAKAELARSVLVQQECESQLSLVHNEIVKLSAAKSTLEGEVSTLTQELHSAREGCTQAESELLTVKTLLEKKASEIECLQSDFDMVSHQLRESLATSAEYANKQKQLESLLTSTQKEARQLAGVKMSLEQKMEELTTQVVAAQKRQQHAEDEMQSLKGLLQERDSEIQRVHSDLSTAQCQLEELNKVYAAEVEKASHTQSSLQDEVKVIGEKLQESAKKNEELLKANKQSDSQLQASEKSRHELQALVASLQSQLSSSNKMYKELECKAATAKATIKRQEREWRVLAAETEKLRNKLAQTEAELQQQCGGAQRVQELETALEDLRRELTETQENSIDAWNRVSSLRAELEKSKESVAWLRTRMRIYKTRISELEKPGPATNNKDECEGVSDIATPATPSKSGVPLHTPVVTQLSVHAQSPNRAEFCMTVSACRDGKSASGTPAAKLFKRTLSKPPSATKCPEDRLASAASRTATVATKRSLFSQTSRAQPPKPQEAQASSSRGAPSSASTSGVMTRNRRATASSSRIGLVQEQAAGAKTATPTQQRGVPHSSSAQASIADKENIVEGRRAEVTLKRKQLESPQMRPNTRRSKQSAIGMSPFGRDSSNIRTRTGSGVDTRKRLQRHQQQEQQPQAEKAVPVQSASTAAAPPCAKKAPASSAAPPCAKKAPAGSAAPPCAKKAPASSAAPKAAGGVMTRSRASAGADKPKPESEEAEADCNLQ